MKGRTVEDVMTGEAHSVRRSTPLSDVTRILAARGISAGVVSGKCR
ncbi:hypothetical protein C791_6218 [Amycolatopsis azurea DSM 43854]|uniref:CBS domain-containing protein n=1 Tax=Amycolatopsis azurea DSM 43854 TaxID=1238180 RepID=M2PX00_9PSEU|nr:hypothetical protein C791_6218 [Amycolatopsis azurea DSM 43854]